MRRIERLPGAVAVEADGCEREEYDEVVIAAHSDQALAMLADPSAAEREILARDPLSAQRGGTAHRHLADAAPAPRLGELELPPHRRPGRPHHRHLLDEQPAAAWTPIASYFVTLNRGEAIDPAQVIRRLTYDHPIYTRDGVHAQARHGEISGPNRTRYCGAYWGWGFHEDGVVSANRACAPLLGDRAREKVAA